MPLPEMEVPDQGGDQDKVVLREQVDELVERLETLALDGPSTTRLSARRAAQQTVEWAMANHKAPASLRNYPAIIALLRDGLLARLESRDRARHPLQEMDRRMRWAGMDGRPNLRVLGTNTEMSEQLRPMPPAVRPADLSPLDTVWRIDGVHLRLGEMTGAQLRSKRDRALRMAIGHERTYRLFDGLAGHVDERQCVAQALDDDRAYHIAVTVLGEEAALSLLGRRASEGPPDGAGSEEEAR